MTTARQHYPSGSDTVAFARQTWAGLRVLLVLTVLLGFVYPLAVTGIAQVAFPWQANGSLVASTGERVTTRDDAVGSLLIGQAVDGPEWFHPRPSAAGDGYDTLASAGSNLGPVNADLLAAVEERRTAVADAEGVEPAVVPVDALTASASGLDPDISPEYARLQVARVARERGLSQDEVQALVDDVTVGRDLGVLGEPRVNVLRLNLALQTMDS
ncbi:potassium-transporting ATPase subunit KdpC [Cellulomonas humilata]|uniref:Potassium-transporting ATPase KdpC subunit n=1 Tax=Cellulomonas humilata TaxID=144055 RepID=A0A7Y5ZYQ3_9CELL|nr:potassium-transporting ATPase subunit KdpC [Cellulomonas humilata]NUU16542.1 potassium-transporting ATPase subunit KdpC [Cellulomonas humilata]